MTSVRFNVTFHAPFAVAAGIAHSGMDTTIDRTHPLPSTAIKGLLKAQLGDVLGAPSHLVSRIFHAGDNPRWVLSDAVVDVEVNAWARVKVDDDGRADERQLMVGEQAYATNGEFVVTWVGPGTAPVDEARALRAAARCVTSLGSHRRRGLGWVSITDTEPWTDVDSRAFRSWVSTAKAGA